MTSCDEDDETDNNEELEPLIEDVHGLYRLRAATTNEPIDINLDGVAQTDLFEEVRYCNNSLSLISFKCIFQHTATYDHMNIEIPTSQYVEVLAPSTCIRDKGLFYEFDYDVENYTVRLVPIDYWDDFAADYRTKILNLEWEPGWAYITVKKEFYNSDEEWQEVILYLEYEKTNQPI